MRAALAPAQVSIEQASFQKQMQGLMNGMRRTRGEGGATLADAATGVHIGTGSVVELLMFVQRPFLDRKDLIGTVPYPTNTKGGRGR